MSTRSLKPYLETTHLNIFQIQVVTLKFVLGLYISSCFYKFTILQTSEYTKQFISFSISFSTVFQTKIGKLISLFSINDISGYKILIHEIISFLKSIKGKNIVVSIYISKIKTSDFNLFYCLRHQTRKYLF